jgi:hypothetical protein
MGGPATDRPFSLATDPHYQRYMSDIVHAALSGRLSSNVGNRVSSLAAVEEEPMPAPLPSAQLALIGRLLGTRHGSRTVRYTTLVGYSSFMLLVAIAAIAVLTQVPAGTTAPPGTTIGLSS